MNTVPLKWTTKWRSYVMVSAALASVVIGSLFASTTSYAITDADLDGIEDSLEQTLLTQYAPKLYLHPDEDNKPSSIDWYLQRVSMRFHHDGGCSDDQILALGSVTQTNLSQQAHQTKNWVCSHSGDNVLSSQARNTRADEGFFLQPPNDNHMDDTVHLGSSDSADWKAYAHVKPSSVSAGGYDIQYWFFYPYNDAPSVAGLDFNHEGDWEHITVTVDSSKRFVSAYFAAHNGEGKDYSASQLQFATKDGVLATNSQKLTNDYTHPVLYSAIGTHASYPTAGTQSRGGVLPNDYTGNGSSSNTYYHVVNLGELKHPLNGQAFINYAGLWGEIGATDISTGPVGPAFQSAWNTK
ncbi:Vps62-related protein [Paenibacillus sp. SYP-B3998]|uniref:Vps62-related protein n=1 Tax=Paenibacillus sp. SYP-B3998 TaxID=2678564 RepID=A0A6G3ZT34_9BACL|nr:Vps62-related protein [Paenibacillus sp. SYP-B3998]NEW04864.1 Vps62-related protein [Paenibacillus sp. SYP-B3998]